jgi:hypothetical protein
MTRGNTLRVGIVADTHSHPNADGLQFLKARAPDLILHAGDIGDLGVLETLERLAPVHAVRGNIDERAQLPDALAVRIESDGSTVLTLFLTHIALFGPRLRADAATQARSARASLVVCGHSHVPFLGRDRGLTVFNPGSIGPRRFTLPILFGFLTLSEAGASLEHVDCTTGQTWLPPS